MSVKRFTDRWVSTLRRAAARADYADALCPGLHLRVTSRGTKTFSVMVREESRLVRKTLGRYPAISLAEARRQARLLIAHQTGSSQPAAKLTLRELIERYAELHLKPNTRSCRNIIANLRNPTLQRVALRDVQSVRRGDLIAAVDEIVAQGKPQAALNVLRSLKMMFNWAYDRDLIAVNPAARIRPPVRGTERDRILSDAEIARIWRAAMSLPAPYRQMYQVFFLTGQRRSEVATMRWCDLREDAWHIPRHRVKKDRAHLVPLTPALTATIKELPQFSVDAFVFTTTDGRRPSSNFAKVKAEIDRVSGVRDWRIHDIRRTVRTKLAQLGVRSEVARKLLNHQTGKIDRIYDRYDYFAERRVALQTWHDHLNSLLRQPSGDVDANGVPTELLLKVDL